MGVLSVTEAGDRRRSSYQGGVTTHTRVFKVKCSDPRDGTAVALTANGVPQPGSVYRRTVVNSLSADPVANSNVHFEVEVTSTDGDKGDRELHPLDRPPELSYGYNEATEDYFEDVRGDGDDDPPRSVVNSANDPFEQFNQRETGSMVITITRNEAEHDANASDLFSHSINRQNVTIGTTTFAPKTLKLSPITATRVIETWQGQEVEYFKRVFVLKAKRSGWDDKILDVGLNEQFTVTESTGPNGQSRQVKKKRPIVDANGLPVKKPVPLNGQGQMKVLTPDDDQPVSLTFRPYARKSWAPLNLLVVV